MAVNPGVHNPLLVLHARETHRPQGNSCIYLFNLKVADEERGDAQDKAWRLQSALQEPTGLQLANSTNPALWHLYEDFIVWP